MSRQITSKEEPMYGLVLHSKQDKERLLRFCLYQNVPILYPHLFVDRKYHRFWAFNLKRGIALAGTPILKTCKRIFHSIDDLEVAAKFGYDED